MTEQPTPPIETSPDAVFNADVPHATPERPLSEADQRAGCAQHLYLPALVPGEQIDAGDGWVEYLFGEGLRWRDTGFDKVVSTGSVAEGTSCN